MKDILHDLTELTDAAPSYAYQTYAQQPTAAEVESLRTGTAEERIEAAIALNDKYRDGWSFSARLAGICHAIYCRMDVGS